MDSNGKDAILTCVLELTKSKKTKNGSWVNTIPNSDTERTNMWLLIWDDEFP